jgi:excinuclease ABC subunit A
VSFIPKQPVENLNPKEHIVIKGARMNNLKNVDVGIPRNKLVVITGLSGSGKSSLAFDTLFAEGQRMYVESLSSYARQFLGRMEKPDVDYIKGVSPAIAIEQKAATKNPRSTVGTTTEIYDYLKLLFARIGKTISPVSGQAIKKDTVTDVVNWVLKQAEDTRILIKSPLNVKENRGIQREMELLIQKGFTRVVINDEIKEIEDVLTQKIDTAVYVLVDRVVVKHDEDTQFRISDSVQTAFFEGEGSCMITVLNGESITFSDKFELDGILFEEPSVNLFTFNNPYGACKTCEGMGKVLGLDKDLIFPDKNLSVFEGAIAPWRTEKMSDWVAPLIKNGVRFDFPIHRSYKDLDQEHIDLLWSGNQYFKGLTAFFEELDTQSAYKIQYRVLLSKYRGRTACPDCRGSRLRKDAAYVKINEKSITDLVLMPINEAAKFFNELTLDIHDEKVGKRLLVEIKNRFEYMQRVGLGYLTLNRLTSSLSGGEYQRIKLATSLGSALVGSMYILDEPSIGLHPRDTQRLISVLKSLRDMGNTVIVVEHEEEVMRAADEIIDIGPNAGIGGGNLVFQGTWADIQAQKGDSESHTVRFLTGEDTIETPSVRRKIKDFIEVVGATENNLKDVNVKFPLGVLCVVTGVSGSGKSTLVRKVLYPAMARSLGEYGDDTGKYRALTGGTDRITQVEIIDQNPIGKSSRSNPVTYVKAYDYIRQLMSEQPISKNRDYKPAFFSFNVEGGRCEICNGEGEQVVEMQFMADIRLKCDGCGGKRFKQEILDVKYNDKNISEILNLTIDEAMEFFKKENRLLERLRPLQDVGLGYVGLGQSSNTLSGGEAQRVKLASFLMKGNNDKGKTLFVFDEPTTGLHFHDIKKLLKAINALIEQGDSVIIIEHNMEVIKSADYIIDLGPEGGDKGGFVCFEGTPEEMIKIKDNFTADFLKENMK